MNKEQNVAEQYILEIIKEQRASRRWKIFFRLIFIAIILTIIYEGLGYKNGMTGDKKGKQVAVVSLNGMIDADNDNYSKLADGLSAALDDKDTIAVIIKANSPGGSPVYSDMMFNEILRQRALHPHIPIDVVVEDMCASGCYYTAAAANDIYASPASIVGSIGVIYTGFGLNKMMDKIGVDSRLIISGKNKAMGYPFLPPNLEQQQMQQVMLDEIHDQFIAAVKKGRGKRLNLANADLFSGRYWIGQDGIKLGLIDGFATVDSLARDKFKSDNLVDFTPQSDPLDRITKKLTTSVFDFVKQNVMQEGNGIIN
jgi:protease-4